MRLVGATPRQIAVIATVESGGRRRHRRRRRLRRCSSRCARLVAPIPFTGAPFFTGDLSLSLADIAAVVALGVPAAAAVVGPDRAAARPDLAARGDPAGHPAPPRAWRLVPLLAGLAELAVFIGRRQAEDQRRTRSSSILPGFLLVMAGLVIAGPWLTMVGARLLARPGQPTRLAHRRPPAGRQPAGRLPRHQRTDPGAVRGDGRRSA